MDTKRILLVVGMLAAAGIMFVQVKKMGTPPAPQQEASAPAPVIQETPMSHILVPIQTIPMGTRLTPEMLEWVKWPTEAVSEVFIEQDAAPNAIEDYTSAIARMEIAQGEPLTLRKLIKSTDRSVMSALLPAGLRAVTIRITSDSAVAGFIAPGDKVDIILTRRIENAAQAAAMISETIFTNVTVLSIDQQFRQGADNAPTVLGSMATFELSQKDAEILTTAQTRGDLSLTLRPMSTERARFVPSRATIEQGEEDRVASMSVYRGGTVEQVVLKGQ